MIRFTIKSKEILSLFNRKEGAKLQQDPEKKMLNKAEFERLCQEACQDFVTSDNRAKDEETLWFSICRNVYNYLNQDLILSRVEGGSDADVYRHNLQLLVKNRQSEPFHILSTAHKHIKEVIGDE